MNNFSLVTADRTTHLKVVAVALFSATLVAAIGIGARIHNTATSEIAVTVIKTTNAMTASAGQDRITIR
ncbi:MAG: hypothetical protein ACJ8F3_02280 [Xanthobacteraceae bacterium]